MPHLSAPIYLSFYFSWISNRGLQSLNPMIRFWLIPSGAIPPARRVVIVSCYKAWHAHLFIIAFPTSIRTASAHASYMDMAIFFTKWSSQIWTCGNIAAILAFSEVKEFRVVTSKYWFLYILSQQMRVQKMANMKQSKSM